MPRATMKVLFMINTTLDRSILEAAMRGYLAKRNEIDAKINELAQTLNARLALGSIPKTKPSKSSKRQLSAEARKRIADAQKRRWAAFRKLQQKGTNA